jgi:hypothetical protein
MAAFAGCFSTVIQFQAGMIALSAVAHRAGFRAIDMNGLSTLMAQATGRPIRSHVGYIRQCIHMVQWIAFIDMAKGAVYIGFRLMKADPASIIRVDRKYTRCMTTLAFVLSTVVQSGTGMVAYTAMA